MVSKGSERIVHDHIMIAQDVKDEGGGSHVDVTNVDAPHAFDFKKWIVSRVLI